ncbi:uncharacterized protein CANTADRAFT_53373 [Suhomyces tanzawaensis NRRL Y-17324]|uniref:Uncharacterized protein n=1 Tax=Suhomyces tanzawaensis NRRL Y-17324 TaxID=984487 RepID=A0A1E4SFW6_9ASCO|nr:uncharacterized protein CANTADRAFT_53373 [Suhomyces tanzawaensis NRRL Y-17324]ODV78404.1 hypothetical protein CANTADRAFT_53373 [Suhomyces tanzawaensis NRRL Y-17324]
MIQKFVCVPKSDYDVIVISNGTIQQIEAGLANLNESTNNEIPLNGHITYLDTFDQLANHLKALNKAAAPGSRGFSGKVLFMFFNGLDYVQDFLSSLIDYYNKCTFLDSFQYHTFNHSTTLSGPTFNTIVSITNDILKKMTFMLGRVRGLYIDDTQLAGEKSYPLRCLARNFPNVERIELASRPNLLFNAIV